MPTITIELGDDQAQRLRDEAERRNVSVEELVRAGALALLGESGDGFDTALEYVLVKNQGLYQRLA